MKQEDAGEEGTINWVWKSRRRWECEKHQKSHKEVWVAFSPPKIPCLKLCVAQNTGFSEAVPGFIGRWEVVHQSTYSAFRWRWGGHRLEQVMWSPVVRNNVHRDFPGCVQSIHLLERLSETELHCMSRPDRSASPLNGFFILCFSKMSLARAEIVTRNGSVRHFRVLYLKSWLVFTLKATWVLSLTPWLCVFFLFLIINTRKPRAKFVAHRLRRVLRAFFLG